VRVVVCDAAGRALRTLEATPGTGSAGAGPELALRWDGRDSFGRLVAPGVYAVRITLSGPGSPEAEAGVVATGRLIRLP
jgi:hypothetical protein